MDWKSFKDTTSLWSGKVADMAKKWFQASKGYAEKTGAWSYEKLKDSRFTLKDGYAYEKLLSEKRYAIFCIRDEDLFTKFFLTILPILFTKAWIESGSIRIIIEEWSEELRNMLEIDQIPSAIVHMDDGTTKKLTTEEDVRAFIKNFSFYDKSGKGTEGTEEIAASEEDQTINAPETPEEEGGTDGMAQKSDLDTDPLQVIKKTTPKKKKDTASLPKKNTEEK